MRTPDTFVEYIYIQDVSRLWGITAGDDFLGLCDQKSSYKHLSEFGLIFPAGKIHSMPSFGWEVK
jgi:hypothetical protein